jgi:hypothetical protein
MSKSFSNSVKKEEKNPLDTKRENVPEEFSASSDNESPIKTVRILKLLILVMVSYYLHWPQRKEVF